MDPEMIMTIVVSLIILAVGVFAFFVTIQQVHTTIPYTADNVAIHSGINNTTTTANSVFNIIGIVLVIGAIMTIVGLVYSYIRPQY
jgi:uncharacterized membrane protein